MQAPVRLIRWFNQVAPWTRYKNRLAKWAGRALPRNDGPVVYSGVQGAYRMRLDLANEPERWMYLNNYELMFRRILRRVLGSGDVYVDGGANLGFLTLFASRCVGPTGKVFAFEPMPPTAARLEETICLNSLANVDLKACAVWDSAITTKMYWFADADSGSVSLGKREDLQVEQEFDVPAVRIEDVVDRPIKAIKLDVEGAELAALRGAESLLKTSRPHILMELNPNTCKTFGYHPLDLVSWVLDNVGDYDIRFVKSRKIRPATLETLKAALADRPNKLRNVWLRPLT
ncbi:hypothetical protein LCGC14_0016590 [marine sediment metagenome]|uniref:Methyltransferase FkbM domain-containing protein n=1 Tax=marine sediment metagenome TaxID=412755 RepID=A0A0F9WFB4_9ZZZZ|nr:FkbM family methyltransferase [Phycisphaerae bacterium]HDZ42367.1 FkbM family methyltransferase [Phycisphaerae bacterium]